MAGFQKNDFGVSSAFGAGNTKIVFIMRIAGNKDNLLRDLEVISASETWLVMPITNEGNGQLKRDRHICTFFVVMK